MWTKREFSAKICPVSYKSTIVRLKALRTEIEHLQLLLEKAKVKLQKDFQKWWSQETSSVQVTDLTFPCLSMWQQPLTLMTVLCVRDMLVTLDRKASLPFFTYFWVFSFVCILNIGLYGHVRVCACACVICMCHGGFYSTSVTLAASILHHVEWAIVGKCEGGKYAGTHFVQYSMWKKQRAAQRQDSNSLNT